MIINLRILPIFALLSGLVLTSADAGSISAGVSRTDLSQAETLQLQIEIQGDSDTPPDLSPIYQDFEIVGRSQNRQTRIINGNRRQRASLNLTLQPKRAGILEIPAIRLGNQTTQPIQIQVSAAAGFQDNFPGPTGPRSSPFAQPWGMPQFPGLSGIPDFSTPSVPSDIPTAPLFPPSMAPPPYITEPPQETSRGENVWQSTGSDSQPATAARPQEESNSLWLTWFLAIGWMLTLIFWWRSRNRSPATQHRTVVAPQSESAIKLEETAVPIEAKTPPLAPAIQAVKDAYEAKDPTAAKATLLHWGEDTFHDHSPANLSRLAALCPGKLSEAILQLDKAFFSPEPSTWWEQPVWQLLTELTTKKSSK